MYIVRYILIGLTIIGLVACQPLQELPTTKPATIATSVELSPLLSPIATTTSVPASQSPLVTPPVTDRFQIARPIRAGATLVRGTGIKGTAIKILDLTHMGVELGSGIIQEDGHFTIEVEPLPAHIRIGIQLVEPNDTIWQDKTRLGPEALVVPLVGIFVDTALINP